MSVVTRKLGTIHGPGCKNLTPAKAKSPRFKKMPDHSPEEAKLVESYGIDSNHEDDLGTQIAQMAAFEHAAEAGDWKSFKRIVDQSGEVFLKLMRSADGSPSLRLPLMQSGELEESFTRSLRALNKDWTHLMPWWAKFGYKFETALTWIAVLLALGSIGAAAAGNPVLGGSLGAVVLGILVLVDNAEPSVRNYSKWWIRLVYPKPKTVLSRWRTASYIIAGLMILWFLLAPTFKTAGGFCDDLSPAEIAVYQGCGDDDPFAE
jgi:hypothetical protein